MHHTLKLSQVFSQAQTLSQKFKMSQQSSSTTPDPFDVGAILTAIESDACPTGHAAYISIPQLSPDGILPIAIVPTGLQHYQDRVCGNDFGIEGGVAGPLVCKFNIFY